jgi:hypothetical protein
MGVYGKNQITWTCGIKNPDGTCNWGARPDPSLGFSMLSRGTAHRVIVESAKRRTADLIIVSTHGRMGLLDVLIGSGGGADGRHGAMSGVDCARLPPGRAAARSRRAMHAASKRTARGSMRWLSACAPAPRTAG